MAEVAFALFAVLLGCLLVWRFSTFEILEISSVFAVGTLFGIGFCSCLFFLCRLLFPGIAHLSLWLESLLFLLVTADLIRTRRRLNFHWPRLSGLELSLGALLVLAIAIGTFAMFSAYRLNPQGQWDAWSIWNLRAKFLTAEGPLVARAWSPLLTGTHPEYPLLLSAFVGRCWQYSGTTTAAAPIATSYLFWIALLAVAASGMAKLRSLPVGLIFALVLATTPRLLHEAVSQYADIPLAAFMLTSIMLLLQKQPLWAGFFAGFAGFTKDEGILFAAVFVLIVLLFERVQFVSALMGIVVPACLFVGFKLFLAPAKVSLLAHSSFAGLTDLARYGQIAAAFFGELGDMMLGGYHPLYPVVVMALLLGLDRSHWAQWKIPMTVCALLCAGFLAVYLVTPNDLSWQLGTSLSRVLVQLWPIFIFTSFLSLRTHASLSKQAVSK